MADEEDKLLGDQKKDEKDANQQKEKGIFWRNILWIIICLLLVLVSLLVIYDIFMLSRNKCNTNLTEHEPKQVYKNVSDLRLDNAQLCKKVADKVKPITSSQFNIYIVKSESNLTNEQACGIESILRLFPDKTIYLVDFTKPDKNKKCSYNQNYLTLLTILYKDRLQVLHASRADYFKHTPLESYHKGANYLFPAMVMTAYKFGGFVASSNVIMTNRDLLGCLPEETIVDSLVLVAPKKCDDFLHYLMQSLSMCNHGYNLDEFLAGAVQLYTDSFKGKVPLRRLGPTEICAHSRSRCTFLRLEKAAEDPAKWFGDLSGYCKQVVQAFLGIKVHQMEVEEETASIKTMIEGKHCGPAKPEDVTCPP